MTVKERLQHAVETMSDNEARAALQMLADASGDPSGAGISPRSAPH